MPRPRLGHIQFINCLPLYYGMVKNDVLLDVDLVRANPADLAVDLVDGTLDLAPIPAIEYARHAEQFVLLPDIAISSDGEVQSILLVSKVPPRSSAAAPSRSPRTRARRSCSAASCCEQRWGVTPDYVEMPPDLPAMLRDADAALLIGDEAIRAYWEPPSHLHTYDLGTEWKAWTGLPFVFAVWAVRREYAEAQPEAVQRVADALTGSLALLPRAPRRDQRVRRAVGVLLGGQVPQLLRRAAVPLRAALPRRPDALPRPRPTPSASSTACPSSTIFGETS